MKAVALGAVLVLGLLWSGEAKAQAAPAGKDQPPHAAQAAAKDIADDLREARKLLSKIADEETRDKLELILIRNELKAADLESYLAKLATAKPTAITAQDFAKIRRALKGQSFDDGRYGIIESATKKQSFTSAQVKDILKAFSFDETRIKIAVMLHPQTIDPEDFFTVYDAFSFSSSVKAVQEKLKKQ
jgi:hypothetical protein